MASGVWAEGDGCLNGSQTTNSLGAARRSSSGSFTTRSSGCPCFRLLPSYAKNDLRGLQLAREGVVVPSQLGASVPAGVKAFRGHATQHQV